ncbi:MAG: AAA family ATPase [Gammaproteobacteria bacterium]|nr:AAA family ATPase [Gammaproteobacteria bacterium]
MAANGVRRKVPSELESFLEALPEPRIVIDSAYRIVAANRAYRESYTGGVAPTGRRCHEVSHGFDRPCDEAGESCPLRAARASGAVERVLHVHRTPRGDEHVEVELVPVRGASRRADLFVERMQALPSSSLADTGDGLVGRSPAFARMLALVSRVAPTDTSVLLLGETGTGKEMVARAIHEASPRAKAPFVAVDCSGLAETLFESELFGHERGAFTGALARKTGLVEAAAGGTLFLDEVGDIPLGLQVKLLRLLETGAFRRVGGIEPLHADFRLIAATHRNLVDLVRAERFRSDLYFRIAAFPVHLPPLRERRADIAPLAQTLLARLPPGHGRRLSADALERLEHHDFPGNVRELRNILERASLLADGEVIGCEHLPDGLCTAGRRDASVFEDAERRALANALRAHAGSRRQLAAALGISERTLYRKLRELGLARPQLPST